MRRMIELSLAIYGLTLAARALSRDRFGSGPIRPAGTETMRDPPRGWDSVDERIDESFPASDPPGGY